MQLSNSFLLRTPTNHLPARDSCLPLLFSPLLPPLAVECIRGERVGAKTSRRRTPSNLFPYSRGPFKIRDFFRGRKKGGEIESALESNCNDVRFSFASLPSFFLALTFFHFFICLPLLHITSPFRSRKLPPPISRRSRRLLRPPQKRVYERRSFSFFPWFLRVCVSPPPPPPPPPPPRVGRAFEVSPPSPPRKARPKHEAEKEGGGSVYFV